MTIIGTSEVILRMAAVTYDAPSTPEPPPVPDPGTYTPSAPITITTSHTLIENLDFSASQSNGPLGARTIFIYALGTAGTPIDDITIRNCRFAGGTIAIWLRHCTNVTIENCEITDADYAGIDLWSVITGLVSSNTVQRIGYVRTDFSDGAFGNNAYGIILNRNESSSLITDPMTEDVVVDSNLVEDVPLWMGLNGHGGVNNTYSNNIVRRCPRAIFNAGSPTGATVTGPTGITITGNRCESPVTKTGGTSDIESVLYSKWTGGLIDDNHWDAAFLSGPFDYLGLSTGVTVGTNPSF